jgi:hypothetical protein
MDQQISNNNQNQQNNSTGDANGNNSTPLSDEMLAKAHGLEVKKPEETTIAQANKPADPLATIKAAEEAKGERLLKAGENLETPTAAKIKQEEGRFPKDPFGAS